MDWGLYVRLCRDASQANKVLCRPERHVSSRLVNLPGINRENYNLEQLNLEHLTGCNKWNI